MDVLLIFYSVILTTVLYFEGVSSFQAGQLLLSPSKPVLGDGDFTLQCTFTLSSNEEQLQGLMLHRKQTEESVFSSILQIPPRPSPIKYDDPSLEARTDITRPDTSLSPIVSVKFNSTECSDIGEYKLVVNYYSDGFLEIERTVDVKVKVAGTFGNSTSGYGITGVSPGYDVTENTTVNVTCKADVGAEPQGQLEWYYYKDNNSGTAYSISSFASKGPLEIVRGCSYAQVSTLRLPMNESLNNIAIRCTLQQDISNSDGDDRRHTPRFNVTYSARRTSITSNPTHPVYSEGTETLTLTCSSDGNPAPSFTWLLPDGTEVGPTYQLQNLQLNDTGNYTCMAKNGIPNENFTDTTVLHLSVEKTTTPAPTTSPSASAMTSKPTGGPTQAPSTDDDSDNKTTIIIAVCVAGGVIIIIIIIFVLCYCSRKNKKKEIEEPPEKPRNNQDVNFSAYRPGLTTSTDSLKNSGNNLNTSFNSFESSDSKPRNEDGLNYVDLQFDDRPRSRRPIQVYDNGTSTQYADIAMPRV